jgi:hypothetical protein
MDQKLFFTFYWLPGYFAKWLDDNRTLQILGGKYDATTYRAADDQMYRVRYYLPRANRKQDTAAIAGPATVDLAESKVMAGGGAALTSAAASAPANTPSSVSGGVTAPAPMAPAGTPALGTAAAATLPPGTSVTVRMVDVVDSGQYSPGKTYRAVVTQAVNAGTITIPQNTLAHVIIVHNGNGWVAQLASLNIGGSQINVSSSTASIQSTTQSQMQTAARAFGNVVSAFGRHPQTNGAAAAVASAASGARVYLPPGTVLTFVVGG